MGNSIILLPCPMCGRTPAWEGKGQWRVVCECGVESGAGAYSNVVAARWNARSAPQDREIKSAIGFYEAVKGFSYPNGIEVVVRVHETGWDVADPDASPQVPA